MTSSRSSHKVYVEEDCQPSSDVKVSGVQQTYDEFHQEHVARVFTLQLPVAAFAARIMVGIPTILLVKFCSKAVAKWFLPITANALGISISHSIEAQFRITVLVDIFK
ncbi:hypothetical protein Tco_0495843 [Tanacetum coccineum]